MDWYNNLHQHRIFSFEQFKNQFLDHFRITIRKGAFVTNLRKLYQFEDKSILHYVCRCREIFMDIPYTLPQEELVKLFSMSCNKHISLLIEIQINLTFEDALA